MSSSVRYYSCRRQTCGFNTWILMVPYVVRIPDCDNCQDGGQMDEIMYTGRQGKDGKPVDPIPRNPTWLSNRWGYDGPAREPQLTMYPELSSIHFFACRQCRWITEKLLVRGYNDEWPTCDRCMRERQHLGYIDEYAWRGAVNASGTPRTDPRGQPQIEWVTNLYNIGPPLPNPPPFSGYPHDQRRRSGSPDRHTYDPFASRYRQRDMSPYSYHGYSREGSRYTTGHEWSRDRSPGYERNNPYDSRNRHEDHTSRSYGYSPPSWDHASPYRGDHTRRSLSRHFEAPYGRYEQPSHYPPRSYSPRPYSPRPYSPDRMDFQRHQSVSDSLSRMSMDPPRSGRRDTRDLPPPLRPVDDGRFSANSTSTSARARAMRRETDTPNRGVGHRNRPASYTKQPQRTESGTKSRTQSSSKPAATPAQNQEPAKKPKPVYQDAEAYCFLCHVPGHYPQALCTGEDKAELKISSSWSKDIPQEHRPVPEGKPTKLADVVSLLLKWNDTFVLWQSWAACRDKLFLELLIAMRRDQPALARYFARFASIINIADRQNIRNMNEKVRFALRDQVKHLVDGNMIPDLKHGLQSVLTGPAGLRQYSEESAQKTKILLDGRRNIMSEKMSAVCNQLQELYQESAEFANLASEIRPAVTRAFNTLMYAQPRHKYTTALFFGEMELPDLEAIRATLYSSAQATAAQPFAQPDKTIVSKIPQSEVTAQRSQATTPDSSEGRMRV